MTAWIPPAFATLGVPWVADTVRMLSRGPATAERAAQWRGAAQRLSVEGGHTQQSPGDRWRMNNALLRFAFRSQALPHEAFQALLLPLGVPAERRAVQELLFDLGIVHRTDNPLRVTFGIRPPRPLAKVASVPDTCAGIRRPFQQRSYAIDSADTFEVDDAVAVTQEGDALWVHVHCADLTRYVPFDSELNEQASYRVRTHYLPETVVPMLPAALAAAASLDPGRPCPALTVSLRFAADGALADYRVQCTTVKEIRRITFDQVEPLLGGDVSKLPPAATNPPSWFGDKDAKVLRRLYKLALLRKQWRMARGAASFTLPELKIKVTGVDPRTGRGKPVVRLSSDRRPCSHAMVEELMLAAGEAAGRLAARHGLRVPYRADQAPLLNDAGSVVLEARWPAPPAVPLPARPPLSLPVRDWHPRAPQVAATLHAALDKLRGTSKASYFFDPAAHRSVSFPAYVQVTSPIRRYNDMLAHYELKQFLRTGSGSAIGEGDTLTLHRLNSRDRLTELLQAASERYWLQYYLQQLPPNRRRFEAFVVRAADNREDWQAPPEQRGFGVVLYVPALEQLWPAQTDRAPLLGQAVTCVVERVDPPMNELVLRVDF